MENKVKTTLNIDSDTIKAIKVIALNKGTTQTKIITEYLKQGLANESKENKENKSLTDLIGIIEVDEEFDATKKIKK